MTDNELIAEFMGGVKKVVGKELVHGYKEGTILYYGVFDEPGPVTYLSFDDDWEWLMPVVSKIAEYRLVYPDETAKVCNLKVVVKREALYDSVVEFIKWYNSNKM